MVSKVVLITGATAGFGAATARLMVREGYRVYGTGRAPSEAQRDGVMMLPLDVRSEASVEACVAEVVAREGRIDVLINNAGMGVSGAIEMTEMKCVEEQIDTVLMGTIRVTRAVLPVMRRQRSGLILNVSSIAALFGVPYHGYYSVAKAGVELFSETLLAEVHRFGIKVVVLQPGDFKTSFSASRKHCAATAAEADYAEAYRSVRDQVDREEQQGMTAEVLAHKVLRIVRKRKPAFHYKVGKVDQVLFAVLKGLLPDRITQPGMWLYYRV